MQYVDAQLVHLCLVQVLSSAVPGPSELLTVISMRQIRGECDKIENGDFIRGAGLKFFQI